MHERRKRRKKPFVKIHKYNHSLCHFNRNFSMTCIIFTCCTCCCIILLIIGVFIYFFARPCTDNNQCQMDNPCTIDHCSNGWCQHDRIESCCLVDADCGESSCYTSFCDVFQNTCRSRPKMNGSSCVDNNACTINNICNSGVCEGKTLTCAVENQCRTGFCQNGVGCVYKNKPNGFSCNDNNPCTSEDECYNGLCAVGYGTDCTSKDGQCTLGACDVTTGHCMAMAYNEGNPCDDGLACTTDDVCLKGVCTGVLATCSDNNPCTIDRCVEGVGCMHQKENDGDHCLENICIKDSDCPFTYNCFDGTCIKTTQGIQQQIRMIDYEIDSCGDGTYKLKQHFVLDTEKILYNPNGASELRYRIIKSIADIAPHPQFSPLGFGATMDEISNIAYNDFTNNMARTAFTISTQCQRFDKINCAYLFTNREFRFAVNMQDCLSISGPIAQDCLDIHHVIWAAVRTSIASCSMFPGYVNVNYPRGNAVIYYTSEYFRGGLNQWEFNVFNDNRFGYVGIETDLYTKTDAYAVITDMKICQTNANHYLANCVDGTNQTACYNTGCFNWDPADKPLTIDIDIIVDQELTAMAISNDFQASGCYGNDNYNDPASEVCTWQKCLSLGMDDNFRFLFRELGQKATMVNDIFIFDVRYRRIWCDLNTTRRRLLGTNENFTTHYAMAIHKINPVNYN